MENNYAKNLHIILNGKTTTLSIEEIFDWKTFNEIDVLTYSASPKFSFDILKTFDKARFGVGRDDDNYLDDFNFSEKLKYQRANIQVRFCKNQKEDHSKIYLLKGKNVFRVIRGSANLSETAFLSNKQYNTIEIDDNKPDLFAEFQKRFDYIWEQSIDASAKDKDSISDIKSVLKQAVQSIETLQRKGSSVTGVSSGFYKLDELTAGFQPSDLVIIASRPSTGKTALALAFTRNAAVDYQTPVLFFSLEMAELQLGMRLVCAEAMADAQQVRTGKINAADTTRIASRLGKISRAEIYIDDKSISLDKIVRKARSMKKKSNIGMIVIDYLQLITLPNIKGLTREQEVAHVSRTLKQLAKELELPVIALSQLNRAVESRTGDKRPQLSDLRESGSLEQDADVIVFLSRPEMYGKQQFEDGTSTKDVIEVIIGKQRNGPVGDVRLKFIKQYTRFENLDTNYINYAVSESEMHKSDMAARHLEQENERPAPPPPEINTDNAPF